MTLRPLPFISFALCIAAQTSPKFEVASIRPVDAKQPGASFSGIRVTPRQFSAGRMSMKQLMEMAYGVKADRIEGPAWSNATSARMFDIEAKMPDGSRPSQVPAMLREMLEDRFKLTSHQGTKVADYYALLVGKDGVNLTQLKPEANDFSKLDYGVNGAVFQAGSTKTTEGPKGLTVVEMSTMSDVAALLDPHFGGLPVVDNTGLRGTYDIKLQYTVPDIAAARAEGRLTSQFISDLRDQVRTGVLDGVKKLGLRVEKQRGEIETLVIDHLEPVLKN